MENINDLKTDIAKYFETPHLEMPYPYYLEEPYYFPPAQVQFRKEDFKKVNEKNIICLGQYKEEDISERG